MPRQPVSAPGRPLPAGSRRPGGRLGTVLGRLLVLAGTVAVTAYGVREMHGVLSPGGLTALQAVFLGLFAVNFLWVAQAACTSLLGLCATVVRALAPAPAEAEKPVRTAVLVPVYNEDPVRVAAAVRTMAEGLAALAPDRFAFFLLSDTNRGQAWIAEERVFRSLIAGAPASVPVHYRHRAHNAERKAGNVADWVERWGGAWEAFLILDADSLVAPETMVRLARRLGAEPGLGLIQTVPTIIRGRTLYGRLQQFANRCYGTVSAAGLAAWHGLSANYWGHNAIVRTRAFAEAARLPILKGSPPFGGGVLSHDFVEAAFLRRAGWGVRIDPDLPGSHEEAPPSLTDLLVRDRRWCQGNLQHARFLFAGGLALPSRLHLLSGILAYGSAALWFALVLAGLLLGVQAAATRPEYFAQPSLFPSWPVFDSERAVALFLVSMGVVLTPKLAGGLASLVSPTRLGTFGGPLALTGSVLIEVLCSVLYAPVLMLAQTRLVLQVLTGGDAGWQPQRRAGNGVPFAEALRLHRTDVGVGLLVAALAWGLHLHLFLWLLPVTAGLLLAPVLAWASGRETPARLLGRLRLLRAEGTRRERPLIDALAEHLQAERAQAEGAAEPGPIRTLVADPGLRAFHAAQLPPEPVLAPFDPERELARAKTRWERDPALLEAFLTPPELIAWLSDPEAIAQLAAGVADRDGATARETGADHGP